MSQVDELFSKYGSAGRVEVSSTSYDSPLFRKDRKKLKQNNKANSNRRIEIPVEEKQKVEKNHSSPDIAVKQNDTKLKLAFAFQSSGWHGSLLDRLNMFSYIDLYKKRISKVKSKTADITDIVDDLKDKVSDGR